MDKFDVWHYCNGHFRKHNVTRGALSFAAATADARWINSLPPAVYAPAIITKAPPC